MSATPLVIHLIITLAMIVLVLLQRSEGGALGIGGGSGGNMFSSRGVGNALTKMTTILAFVFFLTSEGGVGGSKSDMHAGPPSYCVDTLAGSFDGNETRLCYS